LSPEGLRAARATGECDPETPMTEEQIDSERKRYLDDARELATRLHERWRKSPPAWNPPSGDTELDALVWFRYVNAEGLEDEA